MLAYVLHSPSFDDSIHAWLDHVFFVSHLLPYISASCTAPTAVIKSLAEAFAALGFCGTTKAESDEVDSAS